MYEIIFLIVLGLLYLIFASIQDLKQREVANWLNFSLIIFAFAYRIFYSIFSENYYFLLWGIIGFLIFLILAHILYYGRVFAGGDAKLLIALGSVIPIATSFQENLFMLGFFIIISLVVGSFYGLFFSLFLIKNNYKGFKKQVIINLKLSKSILSIVSVFCIAFLIVVYFMQEYIFLLIPLIVFLSPFLYIYAKSIEKACMIAKVPVDKLTEGDWLYKSIKIKNKTIKPHWEGLTTSQLKLIQKHLKNKKILIKQGIPFVPSFLFGFIIFIYLFFKGFSFSLL